MTPEEATAMKEELEAEGLHPTPGQLYSARRIDLIPPNGFTVVPFAKLTTNCPALEQFKKLIELQINEAGTIVSAVELYRPERSVLAQLAGCEFLPYKIDGVPVSVTTVHSARR